MLRIMYRLREQIKIQWIIVSFVGLSLLGWYINSIPPDSSVYTALFLVLIGTCTASISYAFLDSIRLVFIITLGMVLFFLLHMYDLHHPLYSILLCVALYSSYTLLK